MYRAYALTSSVVLALLGGLGVASGSLAVVVAAALFAHFGLCCVYRRVPLVFVVAMFLAISPLEVAVTEMLGLYYYDLVVQDRIMYAIYLQSLLCLPALAMSKGVAQMGAEVPSVMRKDLQILAYIFGYALVIFGVQGEVVVGAGYQAYRDNIAQGSGLIEYSLLFFVFLAVQVDDRLTRWLFGGLVAFYFVKCALLGFRVQAVMSALIFVAVYLRHVSAGRMLFLAAGGFIVALLLGGLKHSGDLMENAALLNAGYIQSPHSGSLASSTNILGFLQLTWLERLQMAWTFWVPFDWVDEFLPWGQPGKYIQTKVPTPGGVLAGVHAYLIAGLPGVFLTGFGLAWAIRAHVKSFPSIDARLVSLIKGSALVVLVFSPRWALYDLGNYGFRMVFTYAILAFLVLTFMQASTYAGTALARKR